MCMSALCVGEVWGGAACVQVCGGSVPQSAAVICPPPHPRHCAEKCGRGEATAAGEWGWDDHWVDQVHPPHPACHGGDCPKTGTHTHNHTRTQGRI